MPNLEGLLKDSEKSKLDNIGRNLILWQNLYTDNRRKKKSINDHHIIYWF